MGVPRPTIPDLAKLDLMLETPRLKIRPWRLEDLEDIWPIVSDPSFPKLMSWEAHEDRADTRAWIERANRDISKSEEIRWAIEHQGKAIGSIGLHGLRWQVQALRMDRGELGYWLAPAFWKQGLMSEAVGVVVRYGFESIGLHKIVVSCMAENIASRRVIEKAAFRWVGRAEDDVWRDGAWHAHLLYELTAPEWPEVHTTMRMQRPQTNT